MGEKRGMKALEAWCRKVTHGYRDVKINNMTTAWRDGLAFCAIIHHFQPDLIDFESLSKENIFHNNDLAFSMAERLGIPALLDAEDMVNYKVPDKLSILTYVSQLYQHFHSLETPSPAKRALEENDDVVEVTESHPKRPASDVQPAATAAPAPFLPRADVCQACKNRVYILERLIVDNKLYHRTCLKCLKCRMVLSPGSYVECDQSDRYECIQCPLQEEKAANGRLSQAVLRRFSETPSAETIRANSPPEEPAKPGSIAAAATRARLEFYNRNLSRPDSGIPDASDVGPGTDGTACVVNSSPVIISSSENAFETLSSDLRNNNVKRPPVGAAANEVSRKPAIPQKPASVAERPRSLPLQRAVVTGRGLPVDHQLCSSLGDFTKSECSVTNSGGNGGGNGVCVEEKSGRGRAEVRCKPEISTGDNVEPVSQSREAAKVAEKPTSENGGKHGVGVEENSRRGQAEVKCKPEILIRDNVEPVSQSRQAAEVVEKPASENGGKHGVNVEGESGRGQAEVKCKPETLTRDNVEEDSSRGQTEVDCKPEISIRSNVEPVSQSWQTATDAENGSDSEVFAEENITRVQTDTGTTSPDGKPNPVAKVTTSSKTDAEVNGATPVAAPRVSRTKRQSVQVPGENKNGKKPVPVPPRRTVVSRKCEPEVTTTPPKPPRRPSPHGGERGSTDDKGITAIATAPDDYPLELNPFGEDEENDGGDAKGSDKNTKEKRSLNPFGDSDDEEVELPAVSAPNQRRLVPCYVNPFSSESDGDSESGATRYSVSPVPSPSVVPLRSPPSDQKGSRDTATLRKKRPAPKPPSLTHAGAGSATPSPRLTPQTPPRTAQKSRGIVPPERLGRGNEGDSLLMEKSLKELDNRNRTKVAHVAPESPSKPASVPGGGNEFNSSPDNRPANTFGNWKRKKKRAPPLPIPRRRQIASISIKEIQVELIEIEEKHLELEKQGVEIEKNIREKFNDEIDPSAEEENLILQLFDLVNKKNELFRRQTELTYLKRQQRLEEEHADLEFQIRCLMEKQDDKKTDEDRALEDQLIARLVEVVTQRSEIIESMEMDRVREAEEDQSIKHQISMQLIQSNGGSTSSQGSLSVGGSIPSSSGKDDTKKTKKEKKHKSSKAKDEDKDTDETESRKKITKEKKKKKWF